MHKGQLSADFYIALVIFLGFIAYITFQLFQIIPANSAISTEELVRIEAFQLSELLINDGGHPLDWDTKSMAEIKRIGLSDSSINVTNHLSKQKTDQLNAICQTPTGYDDIRKVLDIQNEFSITFLEHAAADTMWRCESPTVTNKKISFNVSRTISVDGTSFGELFVEVWKV